MKKLLILIALAALCLGVAGCGQGSDEKLRFGTGGVGGMYYAYGMALADLVNSNHQETQLEVKTTAASAANLRLMREGFLDLAIVQSDMLSDAVKGEGVFAASGSASGYAAVAGLYTEACQIVVAADSSLNSVYDLAGKRVSLGEKESGVLKNAQEILLAHGLTTEMLQPGYLSFKDAADALNRNEIDAFFCTAGAPTEAIRELANEKKIRLLPIAAEVQDNMLKLNRGYTRYVIPADTYEGQDGEIATLGVKAVLVAGAGTSEKDVAYLTGFLLKNAAKIHEATHAPGRLTADYAVKDIAAPFHVGAARYYKEQGMEVEAYNGAEAKKITATQDGE